MWLMTGKSKAMPIDAEPSADGNINISNGTAHVLGKDENLLLPGIPLYKSHFATCPNAKQHRKPAE
jgi:hypothetical protein